MFEQPWATNCGLARGAHGGAERGQPLRGVQAGGSLSAVHKSSNRLRSPALRPVLEPASSRVRLEAQERALQLVMEDWGRYDE